MNRDKKRGNSDFSSSNFKDLSGHREVKMGDLGGEVSTHENVISIDDLNDDVDENNEDDDGNKYDNNRNTYDEHHDRAFDKNSDENDDDEDDDEDGNFNIVEEYQNKRSTSNIITTRNAPYNGRNSNNDDIAVTDIATAPTDVIDGPSYSENPTSYGDIGHRIGAEYGDSSDDEAGNDGEEEEDGRGGDDDGDAYGGNSDNEGGGGRGGEEYGGNYGEAGDNQVDREGGGGGDYGDVYGGREEEGGNDYGKSREEGEEEGGGGDYEDNIDGGGDDTNDDPHSLDGLSDNPITIAGDDSGYDDNAITVDDLGTLDGLYGIDQLSDRSKTPEITPEIPEFNNYSEIQNNEIRNNSDFEVKVVEKYEITDNPMRQNTKSKQQEVQQVEYQRGERSPAKSPTINETNSPHLTHISEANSPQITHKQLPLSSAKNSPYSSSKNSPNRSPSRRFLGQHLQHTSDDNMEDDNDIHYGKNMNDIEDNTSIKSNFYDHGLYSNGGITDALSSPRSPKHTDSDEIRNNERIERQISDDIENTEIVVIGEIGDIQENGKNSEITVSEKYEKYEKYEKHENYEVTDNPMRINTKLKGQQAAFENSEETTDVEIDDTFVFEQMSRSPLLLENDELKKNLIESYDEIKRLKDEMREMRIFFNNRENEITNSAESTIISMENDFHEERIQFDEERRMFIAKQNHFRLDQHDLEDEVKILKSKIKLLTHSNIENQEESKEAKSLLSEINRIKAITSIDEMELKRKLDVASDKIIKFENDAVAMSMLKLAMENRIDVLEDEKEFEFQKHEEQVTGLLKAAGLYDKSGYDDAKNENDTGNRSILSDTWVALFRKQLDEERMKINALKDCLIQFSPKLSKDDNDTLHQAGIILVPMQSDPTTPNTAPIPTIGSRFRRFSFSNSKTESTKTDSAKTPSSKSESTKNGSSKIASAKSVGTPPIPERLAF